MPLYRLQFKTKHDDIPRRIATSNIKDHVSLALLAAAKSVLDDYAPSSSEDGSASQSFELPEAEEVLCALRDALIASSVTFVESTFKQPLRPIVIIHDVENLYGFGSIPQDFLQASGVELAGPERRDVKLWVWFCFLVQVDASSCNNIVKLFAECRGSPTPLKGNIALGAPFGSPTGETLSDQPPMSASRLTFAGNSVTDRGVQERSQDHRGGAPGSSRDPPFLNRGTDPGRGNMGPPPDPALSAPFSFHPAGLHNNDDSRKSNYVQQIFKDNKFSGELNQDILEILKLYGICARQHSLSQSQKAGFIVHILAGSARKFFFENTNEMMSYNEMAQVMLKGYVSDARQLKVKGLLETLRLCTFMEDRELEDVSEGLTKMVVHFNELSPQCPPDFQSDAHMIYFLRKAVVEFQGWSRIPIENITSQKYSFNGFVTALNEAIQNLWQLELLTGEQDRSHSSFTGHAESPFETNMAQYGHNHRFVNKFGKRNQNSGRFQGPRNRTPVRSASFKETRLRNDCHKCGGANWRPGHRCGKGAIHAHTRNSLQNGDSSVHIVADLVQKLEGEQGSCSDDETESTACENSDRDVHFTNQQSDSDTFDALCRKQDDPDSHLTTYVSALEEVDSGIYASHIASSMDSAEREKLAPSVPRFRPGDDQ